MVFVNNKKFACESCVKGHRSSSCHHTDRPLFEIKKKGRPVSQCDRCRGLRQSRRVHSKCTCPKEGHVEARLPPVQSSGSKPKRFIPIVPALPNGLQDMQWSSQAGPSVPSDMRQRVNTLLNPCLCKSVWKCKCRPSNASNNARVQGTLPNVSNGLASLALAAAMRCNEETAPSHQPLSPVPSTSFNASTHQSKHRTTPPRSTKHKHDVHPTHSVQSQESLSLPPIQSTPSETAPHGITYIPTIPSMSTMSMIAGTGCTCGFQCACPGCVEHRGPEHASQDGNDCAHGRCASCVDHSLAMELPPLVSTSTSVGPGNSSVMDRFLARAAALPLPPINRQMGVQIDPMNVMVYPTAARAMDERGVAFGLVNIPKLECCGGLCGCPEGECLCEKSCSGNCAQHDGTTSAAAHLPSCAVGATGVPTVGKNCCAIRANVRTVSR